MKITFNLLWITHDCFNYFFSELFNVYFYKLMRSQTAGNIYIYPLVLGSGKFINTETESLINIIFHIKNLVNRLYFMQAIVSISDIQ